VTQERNVLIVSISLSCNNGYFNKRDTAPTIYGYRCTATTLTWTYKGRLNDVESCVSAKP
jgi:hypothetical protein